MLAFVDQSTKVRVFRVEQDADGHVVREKLGVVLKKDFSLDDQLATLPEAEKSSIHEMVDFYRKSSEYEVLAALHALPSTLRKVVEYTTTRGSKFEREMLLMALVEALKLVRRAEREGSDAGSVPETV